MDLVQPTLRTRPRSLDLLKLDLGTGRRTTDERTTTMPSHRRLRRKGFRVTELPTNDGMAENR